MFSLEEDDGNWLFIIQKSPDCRNLVDQSCSSKQNMYNCPNLTQGNAIEGPHYSDISDDDLFGMLSSQMPNNNSSDRYVF